MSQLRNICRSYKHEDNNKDNEDSHRHADDSCCSSSSHTMNSTWMMKQFQQQQQQQTTTSDDDNTPNKFIFFQVDTSLFGDSITTSTTLTTTTMKITTSTLIHESSHHSFRPPHVHAPPPHHHQQASWRFSIQVMIIITFFLFLLIQLFNEQLFSTTTTSGMFIHHNNTTSSFINNNYNNNRMLLSHQYIHHRAIRVGFVESFFVLASHPSIETTPQVVSSSFSSLSSFSSFNSVESCTLALERWTQLTTLHDFKFTPNLYGSWRLTHSPETAPPFMMGSYVMQDPMPCPDLIEFTSISVSASLYRETYFGIHIEAIFNQTNFKTNLWAVSFQPRFSPVFFEMFAQVQQTNTSNGSEISILNQELISNQTLSDGSFKILQTGSSQYMQPLLMRKKVSGFQVTFQMKLDDLFVTRNVNDTFTTNFTTTTTTTSDIMSTTTTNKPSLRTFLVSNTRELPNKIESKFRFQLLYSKYQLPFSFPIQVKTPYGINSLLFDGVFSLNDPAQDDSLNLQKRVPVANNAISTIIVIVNGIIALTILSLLIIFRNTEPRASRGYLPYVIFIHVFINFAKDFVQSFYGEEYLLIAFVFCTLSVLSFSYLMYFLNTLLFFYKRKVYNDVYQKMKRDSLLDRKKSSSDAYSSPSTLGNNNMLVSTENGTVTTVNHSLTHIVHHTPDLSIHHQNNNNNGIQPVEKQVLTPSNPTTGIELSLTTTTNTTTNITNITNTTTTTTNTINTFPMNHSVIQNNSLSSTSSPPNASNPAAVSKNSFDPVKTEHSMTISLTWVKSRKVRWISAICVAMVVLLSLSAIVPVLMLSSVANVLLTIYAVLGVLVTIGSVLVIGSLSFDMMWNWKRLFYKCEWKAYFFRNDPLYYRLELFIHILSALFYLALSISLLIQRDQIDNLSLLTSQTYRGVAPIATFVSLPIECLAVFFEMMAAGGGFICLMTAYEKIRLRNQEKSKMETLDLISVDDEHSQEEEFPSSAQLEKSSCSFPKMRTNIHSPLMELLGEDLSRLFIDDKGYELLRLYSKSEFSIENVAFINDIEKIYSQLFCDIETNSLKQRRGSGGSTPSFSRLIKPTLKQNLRREVLDSVYSTLCQDFFDLYVSDHAKLPVNFSFQSKVIFNNWLQQGSWSDEYVKSDDFTSDIDFIALDVVRNLRDTFRRFQLTQSYKDWKMQARKQHALLRSALKAKKVSTLAVVVDTATQTVEENRNSQTVVAEDATLSATMVELKERGAENNQDNDTSNHV